MLRQRFVGQSSEQRRVDTPAEQHKHWSIALLCACCWTGAACMSVCWGVYVVAVNVYSSLQGTQDLQAITTSARCFCCIWCVYHNVIIT